MDPFDQVSLSSSRTARLAAFPPWLQAGAIFVIVGLAFSPTLFYDFVTYDDPEFILENPRVNTGLTLSNFVWAFASPGDYILWNPLSYLSHQIDVSLFGLEATGHHAVNVLWHAFGAALLFLVCQKLMGSLGWSAGIALLWALHPQRAQSVAWISERKDVLSGALCFASLLCFVQWWKGRRKQPGLYGSSLFLFILAALAKPSVLPLPLVLLLLFGLDKENVLSSLRSSLRWLGPFLAAASVIALIVGYFQAMGKADALGGEDTTLLGRIQLIVMAFAFYPARFVFPLPARILFPPPDSAVFLVGALVILVAFLAVTFELGRRDALVLAGAAIYLAFWLPVSGIIPVSHYFVADRYSYLPQVGLILIVVGAVRAVPSGWRRPFVLGLFLVLAGEVIVLQKQLPLWKNSETLFGHEMTVNPTSGIASLHYGEFFRNTDPEKALRYYTLAHRKAPEEGLPLTKMGMVQIQLGQAEAALDSLMKATEAERPIPETWTRLLLLLVDQEKIALARKVVESGVERFPAHWNTLMNGGNFHLLVRKDPQEALPLFLRAHEVDPNHPDSLEACIRCYRLLGNENAAARFQRRLTAP